MHVTWYQAFMILGAVQLLLAAVKIGDLPRWYWLGGGLLFITLAQFFSVS